MRTYGRVNGVWQVVQTTPSGDNSEVWLTTFAQVLKLQLGESPFYGNYGIDVNGSLSQQIPPDYYIAVAIQQFSPYFISLTAAKTYSGRNPVYNITAVLPNGSIMNQSIPI